MARAFAAVALLVTLGACSSFSSSKDDGGGSATKVATGPGEAPVVEVSRDQRPRANLDDGKPGDHWHDAFAIYVCNRFLPPVSDTHEDTLGIHSHGDGIIHLHPFSNDAAGPNARMRIFLAQVGITLQGSDLEVGDTHIRAGKTTCSGKPARLVLAEWLDARRAADHPPDEVTTSHIGNVALDRNVSAYTLAYLPVSEAGSGGGGQVEPAKIPPPPSAKDIEELGAADGG